MYIHSCFFYGVLVDRKKLLLIMYVVMPLLLMWYMGSNVYRTHQILTHGERTEAMIIAQRTWVPRYGLPRRIYTVVTREDSQFTVERPYVFERDRHSPGDVIVVSQYGGEVRYQDYNILASHLSWLVILIGMFVCTVVLYYKRRLG